MGNGADDRLYAQAKVSEVRAKGFEPIECQSCGNFTLVRHWDGYKCDTCGNEFQDDGMTPRW